MKTVRWTQTAIDDLREAEAYLRQYDAAIARDTVQRAILAADFVLEFPAIGTPMSGHWRKWRVPKTRYLLIYRPTRTGISIGRVRYDRSNWTLVPA